MDRNSIIGLTLIFILFFIWQWMLSPTPEELEAKQRADDSIAALAQNLEAEAALLEQEDKIVETTLDSAAMAQKFGAFADLATGEEELTTLKNELFEVQFSNHGGIIKEVTLSEYFKMLKDSAQVQEKENLKLLEDPKNRFEYLFKTKDNQSVSSQELYFQKVESSQTSLTYRAVVQPNQYIEQKFSIEPNSYKIDYDLKLVGMNSVITNQGNLPLKWVNYLDKIEINTEYEKRYTSGYFKPAEDDPSYCSCTSDDIEEIEEPLKWVSGVNQFFNSSLIADDLFSSGVVETVMLEDDKDDLKIIKAELNIPYQGKDEEAFGMQFYIGPNEFERLRGIGHDLDQVIPFGSSILGTINRWLIRPAFKLLQNIFSGEGLTILILTLLIKLALYPLTYRMLYSQSKMGALKPHLENMRLKFKDDQQQQQMEQMKLYREYGVNPLGGCMPMLLQMPIWIALYRFFPAAIEFRQASFLWANDLSSYDAFFHLPFTIPFGFGSHLSLFTLLWALTTLVYTYYNTRHMDMSANPAMKYMQYVMPLFFMGFFNSFASGLTCYLLFSNLINITQTLVTKNYIINQDKIKEELDAYRKKPKKKKKGFQARLEEALKEQQRIAAEKENDKKGGKKKGNSNNSSGAKSNINLQEGFERIIEKLDSQLSSDGTDLVSNKSSKVISSSLNELEKMISTDPATAKKSVNRVTARKLRSLLTEVETVVKNQPENKQLAKIGLNRIKEIKSKI